VASLNVLKQFVLMGHVFRRSLQGENKPFLLLRSNVMVPFELVIQEHPPTPNLSSLKPCGNLRWDSMPKTEEMIVELTPLKSEIRI
jgi:hypothetical protein